VTETQDTVLTGLTAQQAAQRLTADGPNGPGGGVPVPLRLGNMDVRSTALGAAVAAAPWVYFALLRPRQLRWGATPEEAHRDLPGDDLVAHHMFEATRAVSIAAPPGRVWPWIVQMGTGRGGFYALDFIDNAMRHSAGRIRPELQHLAVGDVMPTDPRGGGFTVTHLDPERLLVLHLPQAVAGRAQGSVVVTFTLAATSDGGTRLLCRLRADIGPTAASRLYGLLLEAGDFVMVRLMLAGIKNRAERPPAQIAAQASGRSPASSRDER
jgi:hypothetical protein